MVWVGMWRPALPVVVDLLKGPWEVDGCSYYNVELIFIMGRVVCILLFLTTCKHTLKGEGALSTVYSTNVRIYWIALFKMVVLMK